MPPAWDDCQRAIVQNLLPGQVLSEKHATEMVTQYCQFYEKEYSLDDVVSSINAKIGKKWNLQLKTTLNESNGERVYRLCTIDTTETSSKASNLNPAQLGLFERLIELCMEDMRGETLVGNILMEAKALERKMTSTEAQKTLDTLVNTRWLSFDKRRGTYHLGPASIMELGSYLRSKFSDLIKNCHLCKDLCVYGDVCLAASCGAKMHHHCLETYTRQRKFVDKQCPKCAVTLEMEAPVPRKRAAPSRRSTGRQATRGDVSECEGERLGNQDDNENENEDEDEDEDEDEVDDDEEEDEPERDPAPRRRSGRH